MTVPTPDELRAFLDEKKREVHGRAMMSYPTSSPNEQHEIAAFARLFSALDAPILIRHPHADLKLELSAILGPRVSYLITIGDYEQSDLELIATHVTPGDRVMEIGGGAGLTAALSAKRSGNSVVVVEPDERLFALIARQVSLNGAEVIFEHGAVMANSDATSTEFFLDEEIWFSSVHQVVEAHGARTRVKVTVPVLQLETLLMRHRPTVAMIDVEGAEKGLFHAPLTARPRKILIEIHFPHLGERAGVGVIQSILDQGYRLIDQVGWTYVFELRD